MTTSILTFGLIAMIILIAVLVARTEVPQEVRYGPRFMGIVCHRCGAIEQITEITDETVGVWGEKFTCSKCREKQQ